MNEKRVVAELLRAWTMRSIAPGVCMFLVACAAAPPAQDAAPAKPAPPPVAYPSTYKPPNSPVTLIRGATILTGAGTRIENGDVLIANGRIEAVGTNLTAPAGARVIDAQNRWVTPGLIDV
ncbi:MAG TPA: hypothetical protein VHK24_07060, partial [Steroidobacter sp.]|nr:hypothetical protein [Steroidobacter sp.]